VLRRTSLRVMARTRARHRIVAGTLLVLAAGTGLWVGSAEARRTDGRSHTQRLWTTTTAAGEPTTTSAPPVPTTSTPAPTTAGSDGILRLGESGPDVEALQARLDELGYWHGTSDGTYGQLTRQAVMAFQKVEGLERDGEAGPATRAAVAAGVRPSPHDPTSDHIEIDLARQVLVVVEGGRTRWVLNTSTGSGEAYPSPGGGTSVATTPVGRFNVDRQIDGVRHAPLGDLYRPKYFMGGTAIHGAGEVPATPASHGCARVTNEAMDLLWSSGLAEMGTPVLVH
jgi:peptidoglycan hydrolase-like protein with peptidoglycan-binding domain